MDKKYQKYIRLSIAALLFLILIALLIWLVIDIKNLSNAGALRVPHPLRHRHQLSANPILQLSQIEGWMTFRYINYVFNLPTNYLNDKLDIPKTTNLNQTLDKYADARKMDRATFLATVKQAVAEYPNGGSK